MLPCDSELISTSLHLTVKTISPFTLRVFRFDINMQGNTLYSGMTNAAVRMCYTPSHGGAVSARQPRKPLSDSTSPEVTDKV